ncbi:MAG: biopolymer transporter ExbD [Pirellulaceae bacterium]|nr:biopolymer transporter ExbD [Pirellulaceae bacterium]
MRRESIYTQRRSDLDVKMTPMIDVVFLLLVFFVWTASFHIVEHILPSSVSAVRGSQPSDPSTPPPAEEDFDDVVIRIHWLDTRPGWQVNEQSMPSLDAVRASLASIATVKPDAPVILHPDQDVPLGDVIDVYDVTRLEGFEKVQFAASEEI